MNRTMEPGERESGVARGPSGGVPRIPIVIMGLALLCAVMMAVGWIGMNRRAGQTPLVLGAEEAAAEDAARYASMVIPEFSLVDQAGSPRTRESFAGAYTILAFTFTNCPTVCPIMHSQMIRMQETLKGSPVRMVSITVDPKNDTPEALRAHGEKLGADPARWSFFTGDFAEIQKVVAGLRFALVDDPSITVRLADGSTMNNINHPSKLLLVGPDVRIIAMESGLEWESAERLAKLARRLSMQGGPAR